ncbi:MAG TPA: hypothetical protein VHP83_02735 [Aggregatilineaceae bacterium]|nr:hypothetical protein [Aggregatilineaceae bacterium]
MKSKQGEKIFYAVVGIACAFCLLLYGLQACVLKGEENDVKEKYGERVAELCSDIKDDSPSLTDLPRGDTPNKIVMLETGTKVRYVWKDALPEGWTAAGEKDVDLVACMKSVEKVTTVCKDSESGVLTSTSGAKTKVLEIVLLNAKTGARIKNLGLGQPLVAGDDLWACSDPVAGAIKKATVENFQNLLEPYVMGTAEW